MNEPWFDPNLYAWIPGTVFGVLCGCLGGLAGTLASSGKAKRLVIGAWWGLMVAGVLLLTLSVVAYFSGQPYGVWYGFGLPGVLSVIILPTILPAFLKSYAVAEQRRMQSKDLS